MANTKYVTQGLGGTASQFILLGFGDDPSTPDPTGGTTSYRNIEVEGYLITVAEITEVTDTVNVGIFDENAFNRGKVYG